MIVRDFEDFLAWVSPGNILSGTSLGGGIGSRLRIKME
jgi:hypothetical protein